MFTVFLGDVVTLGLPGDPRRRPRRPPSTPAGPGGGRPGGARVRANLEA